MSNIVYELGRVKMSDINKVITGTFMGVSTFVMMSNTGCADVSTQVGQKTIETLPDQRINHQLKNESKDAVQSMQREQNNFENKQAKYETRIKNLQSVEIKSDKKPQLSAVEAQNTKHALSKATNNKSNSQVVSPSELGGDIWEMKNNKNLIKNDEQLPRTLEKPQGLIDGRESKSGGYRNWYAVDAVLDKSARLKVEKGRLSYLQQKELAQYQLQLINDLRLKYGRSPLYMSEPLFKKVVNLELTYREMNGIVDKHSNLKTIGFEDTTSVFQAGSAQNMGFGHGTTMLQVKVDILNAFTAMAYKDGDSNDGHLLNMLGQRFDQQLGKVVDTEDNGRVRLVVPFIQITSAGHTILTDFVTYSPQTKINGRYQNISQNEMFKRLYADTVGTIHNKADDVGEVKANSIELRNGMSDMIIHRETQQVSLNDAIVQKNGDILPLQNEKHRFYKNPVHQVSTIVDKKTKYASEQYGKAITLGQTQLPNTGFSKTNKLSLFGMILAGVLVLNISFKKQN